MLALREPFRPSARPPVPTYRVGEVNRCFACGGTQWLVGRTLSECAFCATALPIEGAKR